MTVTTKDDFKLFCSECLRWQDILGLHGFEFNFSHDGKHEGDFASCTVNCTNRTVLITLHKKWPDKDIKKTDGHIKQSAFHEVCHVLIDLLSSCGRARYVNPHEIEEAEHAIIRTLEKALYSKY